MNVEAADILLWLQQERKCNLYAQRRKVTEQRKEYLK